MKGFLKKIVATFLNKKFLEFCVLGSINTFNTAWISALCSKFTQSNIAACIGYITSLSFAYVLSCKVIFECPLRKSGYLLFLLTYIPNFIIYFLVTFITINTLELPQFWGTVLATMTGGPITFVLMKFFTFNKTIEEKS